MNVVERKSDIELTDKDRRQLKEKRRNYNFVQFYRQNMKPFREMIKKNATAAEIFWFLTEHMDQGNAVSCSSKVLQEITGKGRTTVYKAIKFLKEKGFLMVIRSGTSNVYTLNPNVVWAAWNNNKKYCRFDGPILVSKSENTDIEEQLDKMRLNQLEIKESS